MSHLELPYISNYLSYFSNNPVSWTSLYLELLSISNNPLSGTSLYLELPFIYTYIKWSLVPKDS